MTFIWGVDYGRGWGMGGCAYHEAHRQAVLEPVSLDEAVPDLVDATVPHGIGVWVWLAEETLETGVGRGGASGRGVRVRGCEPAGTTGGVVGGPRWWEGLSHIEQEVRTVAVGAYGCWWRVVVSVRHEAIATRLPTHVARAVHHVALRQRRRRSS